MTHSGGRTGAPIASADAHPTASAASGARWNRRRPARSAAIATVIAISSATAPTTVGIVGLGHSVVRSWRGPSTSASSASPTVPPANIVAATTLVNTATTPTGTLTRSRLSGNNIAVTPITATGANSGHWIESKALLATTDKRAPSAKRDGDAQTAHAHGRHRWTNARASSAAIAMPGPAP